MNDKVYTMNELKSLVNEVLKNYSVKKAILFGSYAKNSQNAKSDIDLIIDSEGELLNINFYGLLEDLTVTIGKKIDLFEISEIKPDNQLYNDINIINSGVVIYER